MGIAIAHPGHVITEDQTDVLAFLASPSTHRGQTVERIDTHASVVFLSGTHAYKLKRAVRFDYLDFSTSERRRTMCEAEVRLNLRTAPTIYRGVLAITREKNGTLAIGGDGAPVDWVVEMHRFAQEALFDRLATTGTLDLALMPQLAKAIATFHACAERRTDHGGQSGMSWVIEGNAAGFAEFALAGLEPALSQRVVADSRRALERGAALLDQRRLSGLVRRCHGDLHLRNIVLLGGHPTLFDGVEFNDEIACIDVLYDLAFLLMDLWRRRLPNHANAVWNAYLSETGDLDGIPVLPLFLSCRAAVRAKTSATAAESQADDRRRDDLYGVGREYLSRAHRLLHPPLPMLIAVGGLSGAGKSTLARGLAPAIGAVPGAVVLRSDELRKRLSGVSTLQRLGAEGYSAEMSARVYQTLADRATQILRGGHSVIVDAVYARPDDRATIEQAAKVAAVPFTAIWLDAAEAVLIDRTQRRRSDPSDADAAVIRQQEAAGTGDIAWRRIDASATEASVLARADAFVRDRCPAGFNQATAESM